MKQQAAGRHRKNAVNGSKRYLLLGLLGVAIVAGAWGLRTSILAKRRPQADLAADQRAQFQQGARQIVALRHRIAAHPRDLQAHQALVALYAQYHLSEPLLSELDTLARLQPSNYNAQLNAASAYGALSRWPEAAGRYRAIVKTWPDSLAGWQGLSLTYYGMKQYHRALPAAQQALRLAPNDPRSRFGVAAASLQWAIQSSRMGLHFERINSAQQELINLLPEWPDKAGIHYLLGHAYSATGKVDLAVTHLQEAHRLAPDSADIAFGLGRVYLRQQRYAEGRDVVEKALAANPQAVDLIELLGLLWQEGGGPESEPQALARFEQAARLAPQNPQFQERLGSAYLRANHLDQARRSFEAAIRIDPNRSYPYQQLAVIYGRLGDKARAGKIAEAARELEFNEQQLKHLESLVFTHPKDVGLHLQLADRYRVLGLHNMAENEYLAAAQLDPHNARARSALRALQAQNTAPPGP